MRFRALEEIAGRIERKRVPFSDLRPWRVGRILLVSSLYDSFTFQEDGDLGEMLFAEYQELNLSAAPRIIRVSTAEEAVERVVDDDPDLVITMPRVGEMDVFEFGRQVRNLKPDLPVALLAYDTRELAVLTSRQDTSSVDRIFVWLGDARVFLAIIKWAEDLMNSAHDAHLAGVKSIILIEDSVRFYSAYLPMLYAEIMEQTQALMAEGVNRMQRLMRMRARPKILLASTYENARELYRSCADQVLVVIVDATFPRKGELDPSAGLDFARMVKEESPDTPILVQSTDESNAAGARAVGAAFCNKRSPTLLREVREFMRAELGFGDFVFLLPDGTEVGRARDLRGLIEAIGTIPDDSLVHHANRNDFSTWLMARTEFDLAKALRPRKPDDFGSPSGLREYLLTAVTEYRTQSRAGLVEEFSSETFESEGVFARIGPGSLGGKGRGLAFVNSLLNAYEIEDRVPGVHIRVPSSAVVATGVFDRFMEDSNLTKLALEETDDVRIREAFLAASLPKETKDELRTFLMSVNYPLAVRSSSLFEDSSFQPFAGIYQTYMIPNCSEDLDVRLDELCRAIRMVYASTYSTDSKSYIESTPNRLEEERMAVLIQQVAARQHGVYAYPNLAGVARSFNYYPVKGTDPEEGVVSAALGLGRMVVEGGRTVRFSPAQPGKLFQFSSTRDYLNNAQREFYALDMTVCAPVLSGADLPDANIVLLDLETAEKHGTLAPVGSVYVSENDRVYDGTGRKGVKLVTMAGVLSGLYFPLPEALSFLLEVGRAGFTSEVEIEFAVNLREGGGTRLGDSDDDRNELAFLQIRPLVFGGRGEDVDLGEVSPKGAIVVSGSALGHGRIEDVRDIIYVRPDTFDRSKTAIIAGEIDRFNGRLRAEGKNYLLIGPGRWGSADHWLGIPVRWSQISAARCIVETELPDIKVEPSQGTHFFQNLTSFGIAYLTLGSEDPSSYLDHEWLNAQPAASEGSFVRHVALPEPLEIVVSSKTSCGAIMKPGVSIENAGS